jgi:hypothetical protein
MKSPKLAARIHAGQGRNSCQVSIDGLGLLQYTSGGPFTIDEISSNEPKSITFKRVDLVNCSPHEWCEQLNMAAKIGVTDAMIGNKPRSRNELVALLATQYRNGHARALKAAYSAGRFHVDVMGKD